MSSVDFLRGFNPFLYGKGTKQILEAQKNFLQSTTLTSRADAVYRSTLQAIDSNVSQSSMSTNGFLNIPMGIDPKTSTRIVLHLSNPNLAIEYPNYFTDGAAEQRLPITVSSFPHNHFGPFGSITDDGCMTHHFWTEKPNQSDPIITNHYHTKPVKAGVLGISQEPIRTNVALYKSGILPSPEGEIALIHPKSIHTITFPANQITATCMLSTNIGIEKTDSYLLTKTEATVREAINADKTLPLGLLASEVLRYLHAINAKTNGQLQHLLSCDLPTIVMPSSIKANYRKDLRFASSNIRLTKIKLAKIMRQQHMKYRKVNFSNMLKKMLTKVK